jgi:hypothetical protein
MELVKHKVVYSKWPDFLGTEEIPIGEDVTAFSRRIDAMLEDIAV